MMYKLINKQLLEIAEKNKLNNNSFADALKEMCYSHEKIQETIKELKKGIEEQ